MRAFFRDQLGLGRFTASLAGLLQAAAMAWPGTGQAWGSLQIFSLLILGLGLVRCARSPGSVRGAAKAAASQTGWFATAWLAGSFWWLYVSMHEVGGLPAPLAVLAVLALAAALALYYVGTAAAWVALVRHSGWLAKPVRASALFAALWTLAELMRGRWFTGFPWGAGGYAHVDSHLAVLAPWLGVYGVGAVAAGLAMRLAMGGCRWRPWRDAALVLVVCAALKAWSPAFTASAGVGQVELLQASIAQTAKFDVASGVRDALVWYDQRLRQSAQPLVVAPETAIPLLQRHLPEGYWRDLQAEFAARQDRLALVGVPWGDAGQGYTNAVVAMGPAGTAEYRYDKFHLVPFGEFVPTGFRWFVQQMQIPLSDFTPGPLNQPSIAWQGQRLALNICYEDLFGEELAARFRVAEQAPTALVNVSNIGWFGNTVAVDQHLNISRMRALELQRPMLRATNTGATAIIDHQGQVLGMLERFTRGSLVGSYEGRMGLTPFVRWAAAWGVWPLWCLGLAMVGWAWLSGRRKVN
ncbi:apolipoprotein N-acyltransferase [Limnohabitans radicicola]|uniref:Apolipoprotein N-acyltransferase n=1 Tax=Limnohabitans radicicola TaxID=2771427 RepID=A0A927FFT9_9BURK|nr:apolipoprotein N-acyltransferase [Limnohabitans radicicola]MBD8049772.1 apolipoprotein N-acyltransferase [Limnohabitans radicicola]